MGYIISYKNYSKISLNSAMEIPVYKIIWRIKLYNLKSVENCCIYLDQ